jgi:hypothetical protein
LEQKAWGSGIEHTQAPSTHNPALAVLIVAMRRLVEAGEAVLAGRVVVVVLDLVGVIVAGAEVADEVDPACVTRFVAEVVRGVVLG